MSFWTDLQGVPFRLSWVNAGGIQTRVLEAGSGSRTILMLHGVQGHLEVWQRNVAAFAAQHRVVAFDLLGHGFTDKPDHPYEIRDYIDHALALCDAMSIDTAVWIGSSLGGWVSARVAAQHPQRVSALVLASTAGLTADPQVMAALKRLGERAATLPGPEGVRERLKYVIHDPAMVTEELVDVRWRIYSSETYRAALRHVNILQEPTVRARNLLSEEELGRIRAPTLIVWTDHDPTATLATGERYARAIPGARFVVIHGSSHIPALEDPQAFNRHVLEFLSQSFSV